MTLVSSPPSRWRRVAANSIPRVVRLHFGSLAIFAAVLLLSASAAVILLSQGLNLCDDAYITFRHVNNLVEHGKPSWNIHGKPVLGSTSPAFLFVLAGFKWISDIPTDLASLYLNAGLQFLIVIAAYMVLLDLLHHPVLALVGSALIGFHPLNVFIYSQGFENALLIFVLLFSLYLYRREMLSTAAVLAGFAPLIRPEGILLPLILVVHAAKTRKLKMRQIILGSVLPISWVIFSFLFYGSPIPNSVIAKSKFASIYAPFHPQADALEARITTFVPKLQKLLGTAWSSIFAGSTRFSFSPVDLLRLLFFGSSLAYVLFRLRFPSGHSVYLIYAPLFLLTYALVGQTASWYMPSFVTFALILLFFSSVRLMQHCFSLASVWAHNSARFFAYTLVLVLFFNFSEYAFLSRPSDPRGGDWELQERQRFRAYRKAALVLNSTAQPGAALIPEVGYFGYFYKGDVIDSVGLCSPEAFSFYPPAPHEIGYSWGNNFIPNRMIEGLKPSHIVSPLVYVQNLFAVPSALQRNYTCLANVGIALYGPVLVFARDDVARILPTVSSDCRIDSNVQLFVERNADP